MKIANRILDHIKATKYNIGFIDGDLQSVLDGKPIKVNWLKHYYKDRWFADPFILEVIDDEIVVLVEEWYDPIQYGRISKLVIDKKTYELKSLKVMIDDGSHMSFPAIERVGQDIYIYPENSSKGELVSYKYNKLEDKFEKSKVLCRQPLTDSIITNLFGKRLMFSTKLPDANGKELGIYGWNDEHKCFENQGFYHFTENVSRMAGAFFTYKDKIYRPAQVCIKSYGDAVSLQEVVYDKGRWSFDEVRRVYSPHPNMDLGFHTFNVYQDMIVVDALGFRKPRFAHILQKTRRLLGII